MYRLSRRSVTGAGVASSPSGAIKSADRLGDATVANEEITNSSQGKKRLGGISIKTNFFPRGVWEGVASTREKQGPEPEALATSLIKPQLVVFNTHVSNN